MISFQIVDGAVSWEAMLHPVLPKLTVLIKKGRGHSDQKGKGTDYEPETA